MRYSAMWGMPGELLNTVTRWRTVNYETRRYYVSVITTWLLGVFPRGICIILGKKDTKQHAGFQFPLRDPSAFPMHYIFRAIRD